MSRLRVILVTVCAIALLCVACRLFARESPGKQSLAKQKVAYLLQDGRSHLLTGDSDGAKLEERDDAVLPRLLDEGWRIARIDMTASAGVTPDQVIGIVVLEE